MGIRTKSFSEKAYLRNRPFSGYDFWLPADDVDYVLTTANGDLDAAVVGTAFTLSGVDVPGVSLFFDQTDAAGTTLSTTFRIVGRNQFGDVVREDVSLSSDGTAQTLNAYSFVTSITPTLLTAAAASDTLAVGIVQDGTAKIKIGLPMKVVSADLLTLRNKATMAVITQDASEHSNYHTLTPDITAGTAIDVVLFLTRASLLEV